MTDIPERLRTPYEGVTGNIVDRLLQVEGDNEDAREAAAEIRRLEARLTAAIRINTRLVDEVERLRVELEQRDRIMNMSELK